MWSRRPLRRAIRPPLRQIIGPRAIPPMLLQANKLFRDGLFDQAAILYLNLAKGAEARKGPRAPQFYLQAALSYLYAEDVNSSSVNALVGLELLLFQGRLDEVVKKSNRVINEYRSRGFEGQAKQIEDWLHEKNTALNIEKKYQKDASEPKSALPVQCPNCGAPVRSGEVEWVDDRTAECVFCSGMIRTVES